MATWQLLLAVWAIGIPALLLTPALLPPRRSLWAPLVADEPDGAPASLGDDRCPQAPRRARRGHCVPPPTRSRQARRHATL
jgi:hypothetical protein